jgi:hypothetical protein
MCYECGKPGHMSRECPDKARREYVDRFAAKRERENEEYQRQRQIKLGRRLPKNEGFDPAARLKKGCSSIWATLAAKQSTEAGIAAGGDTHSSEQKPSASKRAGSTSKPVEFEKATGSGAGYISGGSSIVTSKAAIAPVVDTGLGGLLSEYGSGSSSSSSSSEEEDGG